MSAANDIETLFQAYCTAFERRDAAALGSHFAYPCHIVGDAAEPVLRAFADAADYVKTISAFLESYNRAGVAHGDILRMDIAQLGPRVAQAEIRWRVRGEAHALYDFDAVYTLVKKTEGWRIVAIAHNELPQLQAVMAARVN